METEGIAGDDALMHSKGGAESGEDEEAPIVLGGLPAKVKNSLSLRVTKVETGGVDDVPALDEGDPNKQNTVNEESLTNALCNENRILKVEHLRKKRGPKPIEAAQ